MRKRGRWWFLGAALVCGIAAACTARQTPTTHEEIWAGRAQEYFAALHHAQAGGFTNLARFYARDAHVGFGLLTYDGYGRPAAIQAMRDLAQSQPVSVGGRDPADTSTVSFDEPLYVSVDGAVDVSRITPPDFIIPFASAYLLGPGGIESESWSGALQAGAEYVDVERAPLERIALDYTRAWASGDSRAASALYSAQARVDDSLAGLSLLGPDPIGAAAARSGGSASLIGATLREVRQHGGPAIYVNAESTGSRPIDRMVLLLHVDEGGGCPGDVAVSLHLEGSTILSEERYHRIDSPVGCWGGSPSGWWDDVPIPDPHAVVRTGTMTVGGLEVAIWNGTPDPSPLITWGQQRFADAGMPAPIPTSVTFLPRGADPWLDHGFQEGTTAPDVALPFPASDACLDAGCTRSPTSAKAAVLHQLAHLYLADPAYPRWTDPLVGPDRMAPFLAEHDLTWLDPARPWSGQASQLAAETLAWGLMDEPFTVDTRMGTPSCSELAADFAMLTRSVPDPRACAETAGDTTALSPGPSRPGTSPAAGTPEPTGPAAAAQAWFDAYDAALDRGLVDLYGYYSTDVTVDHRALGMETTPGRDALRYHLTTMAGAILLERDPVEPLHVSTTGAVAVMAMPGSTRAAFVMSLAPTGITSETYAPSLVTSRATRPTHERLARLQQSAGAYVAAWASKDRPAVVGLYSADARISDDLQGITTTGLDEVRRLAAAPATEGGLAGAAMVSLPGLGGPAVFATGGTDPGDPLDTVVLLLSIDGACPSGLAIVLHLDDKGRITEEARHHSIVDLGDCAVPNLATGPWWEGLAIPPGISVEHSGTLTVEGRTLQVRNSSPALDRLLTWGMQRFQAASLVVPALDGVTFVDRQAPACTGVNGLAAGGDVSLCFGTSDACTDDGCAAWRAWAKKAVLHELSHVWLSQNVTPEVRTTFVRSAGLRAWESDGLPWGQRGVELAADTMAAALMDAPVTLNAKFERGFACAELRRAVHDHCAPAARQPALCHGPVALTLIGRRRRRSPAAGHWTASAVGPPPTDGHGAGRLTCCRPHAG